MAGRRVAVLVIAILGVTLTACCGMTAAITSFYENVLPEAIETEGSVISGSDTNWFDILVPLRREGCGSVVFHLTPETVDRIQQQGISFFDNARQGRGYPKNGPQGAYYSYAPWQPTPAPNDWFGDGIVAASLSCAGFEKSLFQTIIKGSAKPGGFFTTMSEAQLIVLPGERIAVLTYFG